MTITYEDEAPKIVYEERRAEAKPPPKEPGLLDWSKRAAKTIFNVTPAGGVLNAMNLLEKSAHKAGEVVSDTATDLGASPEIAAGLGTAANVGIQAVPMVAGGEAAKAFAPAMRSGAEWFMQSALKPSMKAIKMDKADPAIGTLLDEGITISKGGVEKLQGKVDVLSSAITDALKSHGGQTVDKGAVASRLQEVINRIEQGSMNPQSRVAEVEKIYDEVLGNQILPNAIPVQRAQQIKQGIYQMLRDKYGQLGSDSVEAQKALARGLREEIVTAVPEVAGLNAKESQLINALQLAEHRAIQTRNKDIGGLSWLIENPLRFAAFMADRSPAFKSTVARMLNANQEQIPADIARVLGAGYGAVEGRNGRP